MAKWIKCKKCGHEYMNSIKRCPQCYEKAPLDMGKVIIAVLALLLVAAIAVGIGLWQGGNGGAEGSSSNVTTAAGGNTTTSSVSSEKTSTSSEPSSVPQSSSEAPVSSEIMTYKQPTDSDGNVRVGSDGTVYITMPEWLLLLVEPDFDYQLTDTEKNEYNFTGIKKNSDGSATYSIGYNDYFRFCLLFLSDTKGDITSMKWLATVDLAELEEDGGVKNIKIHTTHEDMSTLNRDTELLTHAVAAGLSVTVYQYFDMSQSVGSVFEYYSKDGELLGTSTFPDLFLE